MTLLSNKNKQERKIQLFLAQERIKMTEKERKLEFPFQVFFISFFVLDDDMGLNWEKNCWGMIMVMVRTTIFGWIGLSLGLVDDVVVGYDYGTGI